MDNIGLMSETVNFIQGSKRNYDSSTMQGGVYFSKDSKEILLNGESYGNAVPGKSGTDVSYWTNFVEGQVIYDPDIKKMKLFNGEAWVNLDADSDNFATIE
jgi:hypothetical protein